MLSKLLISKRGRFADGFDSLLLDDLQLTSSELSSPLSLQGLLLLLSSFSLVLFHELTLPLSVSLVLAAVQSLVPKNVVVGTSVKYMAPQ